MRKGFKLLCLYQVVMHYRIPFYEKLSSDEDFEFKLIYGRGKRNSKLKNSEFSNLKVNSEMLYDIRLPLPFSPYLFFKLIRENPDVIFSEGSSSLINSSIAFLYAKIFGKKFVWWSLGTLKTVNRSRFRRVVSLWEKYIERNSSAIFTYSTQGYDYFISRGVDAEKVFVGVNVFDTDKKLKEINETFVKDYLSHDSFHISFIGTIQKSKNLELLIDVVRGLNRKYNHSLFKLHIVGDGEYFKSIHKYVDNDENIILHGRMNRGASKILKNSHVMVLPGLGGLSIVEGMLNSLPIISGFADGTESDLVDGQNGFIIPDMNYENLFDKIEYYYLNPEVREKHGSSSLDKIINQYSFGNYYLKFKELIKYINRNVISG